MSDEQTPNVDPNQNPGGTGPETDPAPEPTPTPVSAEAYEQVKKDMLRYKDELKTVKVDAQKLREEKLTNEKNWEELAKTRAEERDAAIAEKNRLHESVLSSKKYDAVKTECVKLGIRSEALEDLKLLDMGDVQTELTTLGNINVHGHKDFATRLKTLRPHWFGSKNPPNLNTNTPGVVSPEGPVTGAQLAAAQREGKKSGDMSKYNALFQQYRKQLQAG